MRDHAYESEARIILQTIHRKMEEERLDRLVLDLALKKCFSEHGEILRMLGGRL